MSSHREAPEISKDPVADNTDTYAFVSPDNPDTVTLITNYLPAEVPAGGPNFFEFGNDILYAINIDNDGDGLADIAYEFNFESTITNPNTFLYNTGPIGSLTDSTWNLRQSYTVKRDRLRDATPAGADGGRLEVLGSGLACPPCNIGPRSTPNYSKLAAGSHTFPARRPDGIRWAAKRPILRRHRVDLRPRRPAPDREPAPDPDGRGARRRYAPNAQRPLDRNPDPDHEADARWLDADERH